MENAIVYSATTVQYSEKKTREHCLWHNSGSMSGQEERQEALVYLFVVITVHKVMCHVL